MRSGFCSKALGLLTRLPGERTGDLGAAAASPAGASATLLAPNGVQFGQLCGMFAYIGNDAFVRAAADAFGLGDGDAGQKISPSQGAGAAAKHTVSSKARAMELHPVLERDLSTLQPGKHDHVALGEIAGGDRLNALLDGKIFRYSGSLTTPPCSEGVEWSRASPSANFTEIAAEIQHRCYIKFRFTRCSPARLPFEMICASSAPTVTARKMELWFNEQVDIARDDLTDDAHVQPG
ncbi:Carbonic anhydrase [Phytophthora cinnamomi]|uniref:Carbonic anhydrase n=1 Tax=Phytophthora cinnamomi TaxID=4785 RepID=UPI00355A0B95|nr:Carbonic anhydrase [Phytophthora cinnamomi]